MTRNRFKTAITSASAILFTTATLFAQEGGDNEKSALDQYVLDGGATMIFIALALITLIGLTVFNIVQLTKAKYCPDDLKAVLLDHMVNCRVRSAIEVAAAHPSFLGRMVAYSLPNIDATRPEDLGRDKVEDAIADFTANESRKSMIWINMISLVAQSAPMLGLFGTVLGMVGAFAQLGGGGDADPSALAGDISVALLTTLWGLVTAIIAVICYFIFKNRFNSLVSDCHHAAEELINASLSTINADQQFAKIPEGIAG